MRAFHRATCLARPLVARRLMIPRAFSTAPGGDKDDEGDFDDFGEIGLSEKDFEQEKKLALDPSNPPKLSHEHYMQLSGIDFTDRGQIRTRMALDAEEDWQAKLDQLREATSAPFGFDEAALSKIKDHTLDDEPMDEQDEEIMSNMNMPRDVIPDEDLASNFGAERFGEDEIDESSQFDFMSVNPEDVYDPGAFPLAMDMNTMIPKKKKGKCIFCLPDSSRHGIKEIRYSNVQMLHKFINERGMISNRAYNYNCAKHQKKLGKAIKQARFIGLLSYTDDFVAPESFAIDGYGSDEVAGHTEAGVEKEKAR